MTAINSGIINLNDEAMLKIPGFEEATFVDIVEELNTYLADPDTYSNKEDINPLYKAETLEALAELLKNRGMLDSGKIEEAQMKDPVQRKQIMMLLDDAVSLSTDVDSEELIGNDAFVLLANDKLKSKAIKLYSVDESRTLSLGIFADNDGNPDELEYFISNSILLEPEYGDKNLSSSRLYNFSAAELKPVIDKLNLGLQLNNSDQALLLRHLKKEVDKPIELQDMKNFIASVRTEGYEARKASLLIDNPEAQLELNSATDFILRFPGASYSEYQKRNIAETDISEEDFQARKIEILSSTINNETISDLQVQDSIFGSQDFRNLLESATASFQVFSANAEEQKANLLALREASNKIASGNFNELNARENDFIDDILNNVSASQVKDINAAKTVLLTVMAELLAPESVETLDQKLVLDIKGDYNNIDIKDLPDDANSASVLNYLGSIAPVLNAQQNSRAVSIFNKIANFEDLSQADKNSLVKLLNFAGIEDSEKKANDIIMSYMVDRLKRFSDTDLKEQGESFAKDFSTLPAQSYKQVAINFLAKKMVLDSSQTLINLANDQTLKFDKLLDFIDEDSLLINNRDLQAFKAKLSENGIDLEKLFAKFGLEKNRANEEKFYTQLIKEIQLARNEKSFDPSFNLPDLIDQLQNADLASAVDKNSIFAPGQHTNKKQTARANKIMRAFRALSQKHAYLPAQAHHFFENPSRYALSTKALDYSKRGYGDGETQATLARLALYAEKHFALDFDNVLENSASMEDLSSKLLTEIRKRKLDTNASFRASFPALFADNSLLPSKVVRTELDNSSFSQLFATQSLNVEKPGADKSVNLNVAKIFYDLGVEEIFNPYGEHVIRTKKVGNQYQVDEASIPPALKELMSNLGIPLQKLGNGILGKNVKTADAKTILILSPGNISQMISRQLSSLESGYSAVVNSDQSDKAKDLKERREAIDALLKEAGVALYQAKVSETMIAPEHLEAELRAYFDNMNLLINDSLAFTEAAEQE